VFLVSFATQEMMLFRNAKTGEIAVGAEDKVEQCTYVAVITRLPEELDNELTGGWKVVEVRTPGLPSIKPSLTPTSHRWRVAAHEHTFKSTAYLYLHIDHYILVLMSLSLPTNSNHHSSAEIFQYYKVRERKRDASTRDFSFAFFAR